jgi:hypothetical protein
VSDVHVLNFHWLASPFSPPVNCHCKPLIATPSTAPSIAPVEIDEGTPRWSVTLSSKK